MTWERLPGGEELPIAPPLLRHWVKRSFFQQRQRQLRMRLLRKLQKSLVNCLQLRVQQGFQRRPGERLQLMDVEGWRTYFHRQPVGRSR
jgi:hypothetical protein